MDDKFMENSCHCSGSHVPAPVQKLANKFLFIPSNAHYFSQTVLGTCR